MMRTKNKPAIPVFAVIAIMNLILLCAAVSHARPNGILRAMEKRAAVITKMKNDFVMKVLNQYKIPFNNNPQGVIIQIQVDEKWQDISTIEIVPEIMETDQGLQIIGHNIFFHTKLGILHLTSDIAIK